MERSLYKPLPMTRMATGVTVQVPGAYAPSPVRADSQAKETMARGRLPRSHRRAQRPARATSSA